MAVRSNKDSRSQGRPHLSPALRLAVSFMWHAARGRFLVSLAAEALSAAALAGVLFSGRTLIVTLTAPQLDNMRTVLPAVMVLGGSLIVSALAAVFSRHSREIVGEQVTRFVQSEIVDVSTSVDFESFEDSSFHDQLTRSNSQAARSSFQLVYDVMSLVNVAATSIAVLVVLLTSVPAVLPSLLLIGLPAVAAARASARLAYEVNFDLTPGDRLRFSLYRSLTEKNHARELRVFGLGRVLRSRWEQLYDERVARLRKLVTTQMAYNGLAAVIGAGLVSAVLLVLVNAAIRGRITLGDAGVAIVALQQLTGRIRAAASASGSLRQAAFFLNDFAAFMELRHVPERQDGGGPGPLPRQALRVENVTFRYPGTDATVLHDVSLEIGPGEIVGIVGLSGSGKTTLAHLVAGLYRPTSGRITYGGVDTTDIPRDLYWRSITSVFQDFVRYELTARENIALSDHERLLDGAAIDAAAARAGIREALERLPRGYDTMLSRAFDGGADLSVGQWQRVAVARAFFREAPLLILDEPAASLDVIAEQRMYERLVELCRSRSVLLISHRFSTVRLADRICVMRDGRIIEQGTHAELMALGGQYAELFNLQANSFGRQETAEQVGAAG